MSIRIIIADDHQILRAGLKTLLQADLNLEVVAEATNGDEAILIAEEFKPDIALMDISMPGTDSLQVTRQLVKTLPETRILMLTMHEDCALLREFLSAGASGYIIKRAAESELIDAIYAVWRGMIYVHPSLMRSLVSTPQKVNPLDPGDVEPLTSREIEVLRYIVRGHTNRQIASALSISVRTVETHRSNLMEKLNLHSRAELVQYADEHDLEKHSHD
jgi:two-component system, NarL family, response regulator NreC